MLSFYIKFKYAYIKILDSEAFWKVDEARKMSATQENLKNALETLNAAVNGWVTTVSRFILYLEIDFEHVTEAAANPACLTYFGTSQVEPLRTARIGRQHWKSVQPEHSLFRANTIEEEFAHESTQ